MSSKCQSGISATSRAAAEVIKTAFKFSNMYIFTWNSRPEIFCGTYNRLAVFQYLCSLELNICMLIDSIENMRTWAMNLKLVSLPVFSKVSVRSLSTEDKSSTIKHCFQIEFGLKDKWGTYKLCEVLGQKKKLCRGVKLLWIVRIWHRLIVL